MFYKIPIKQNKLTGTPWLDAASVRHLAAGCHSTPAIPRWPPYGRRSTQLFLECLWVLHAQPYTVS